MAKIHVDFQTPVKAVKPMHGVGQPPLSGISTTLFHYLSDAHIPYSRLHDVRGWFGGNMFVDIPNIFRDFDADENDPANYDFTFTDLLIAGLLQHNCKPIYRLGVTIENFHAVKAYRIYPPKDMEKWARICEHVIRHYNEGWADGFHYNIQYWEIWNEPDNSDDPAKNAMWKGTRAEFFQLYRVTSKHLRKCFGDSIKIGGYGSCGFYSVNEEAMLDPHAFGNVNPVPLDELRAQCDHYMDYFNDFLNMVVSENLPLDFFTHHSYGSVPETVRMQSYAEQRLQEMGLTHTEIHLNEWNTHFHTFDRGTSAAAASAAAMMCAMQDKKMDVMCYYDAQLSVSVFGGLFNPLTREPFCTYYSFYAFGKLYQLGTQVTCSCDQEGLYMLAATDGTKHGFLLANLGEDTEVETNLPDDMIVSLIDEAHFLQKVYFNPAKFSIKKDQVVFIETP